MGGGVFFFCILTHGFSYSWVGKTDGEALLVSHSLDRHKVLLYRLIVGPSYMDNRLFVTQKTNDHNRRLIITGDWS